MQLCAASVQGAVVPGSEYAFAALTCGVQSVSSLYVLPDFIFRLATNLACSDILAILSTTRFAAISGVRQRSGLQLRFAVIV